MDQIGPVEAPVVEDPPQRRAERRTQPPKPTSRAGRDLPAAVGVGVAVGRAVRSALVLIAVLDFFLGLAIWGTSTSVRVAG